MGKSRKARPKALDRAIYLQLVDQLYGTVGSMVAASVSTLIVAAVCWSRSPTGVFALCVAMLGATSVARVAVLLLYKRADAREAFPAWEVGRMRAFELAYSATAIAWGGALGLTAYFAMVGGDEVMQIYSTAVVIGVVGGTAARNASRPQVVALQMASLVIPYCLGLLATGSPWLMALAALIACLAVSVRSGTRMINGNLVAQMVTNSNFEASLANMSQGLCLVGPQTEVVVVNARFNEILGCAARVGAPLADACVEVAGDVRRVIARAEAGVPETLLREVPGGRLVEIRADSSRGDATVIAVEDVTEREGQKAKIEHMAWHDFLTNLPNARSVTREVAAAVAATGGAAGAFSVLMLDLDRFKEVNDRMGHLVGDEVLVQVADRLRATVRERDLVGRVGGDEFIVLMRGGDPEIMAERLVAAVSAPYRLRGTDVRIGLTIGIAPSEPGADAMELRRRADLALYRAKPDLERRHRVYEESIDREERTRQEMADDLRVAIAADDIVVHFQPIVDVVADPPRIVCFEALARWNRLKADGTREMVRPDRFIGLAEETGLIVPLGAVMLRKACMEAVNWPADVRVAVNVSALQMRGDVLDGQVRDALLASNLPGHRLEVEITESQSMEDMAEATRIMTGMGRLGVSVALDDFGTGRSSLAYLHHLVFGKVKIDRTFMMAALANAGARELVHMIAKFAKATGKSLVVEGVEKPEQLAIMRGLGIELVQGYLFSKPVPADEVPALIARHNAGAPAQAAVPAPQAQGGQPAAQPGAPRLFALQGGKRT